LVAAQGRKKKIGELPALGGVLDQAKTKSREGPRKAGSKKAISEKQKLTKEHKRNNYIIGIRRKERQLR